MKLYNRNTLNSTYNASSQSAQKTYTALLTAGKKYRVSFDFIIDGITTATYTVINGSNTVGTKLQNVTNHEVTEFTATNTNLTLVIELSAGNYGRLAHIDNLEIAEIAEVGESYRFGFNGQEKDDSETQTQDYGFRIYNPRLGKFLSVDPLTKSYAFLTPYQFSSNRPIDGIDLDGLEYYSVHIKEDANGVRSKIKVINYTNIKQKDVINVQTANGFGPRGNVGITYVIHKYDAIGKEVSVSSFNKKNSEHGIYAGDNNPKQYWEKPNERGEYPDDYSLSPIDETDANAKQHDLDYDKFDLDGLSGVMDDRSTKVNNDFIERADLTKKKYENNENDAITGKPVTKETSDVGQKAARKGVGGLRSFRFAEMLKKYEPPLSGKPKE